MGFDVIAFESGIYDCNRAWRALQKPDTPVEAAKLGVFGIWTGSKQTSELWRYISDTVVTRRPLELAGFDCQFTGLGSKRHLLNDLKTVLATDELNTDKADADYFLQQLGKLIDGTRPDGEIERFEVISAEFIAKLSDEVKLSTPENASFWRQQIKSMTALARYRWQTRKKKTNEFGINQRDLQMAKNLIWLSEEKYPDRKIIVWAANFHISRNLKEIEVPDESVDYNSITPMGHHLYRRLADRTYTIGFTAYQGQAGAYFRQPFEIPTAPRGTLEDLCVRAGMVNGLIPLIDPTSGDPWLPKKIPARPFGYAWMQSDWSGQFDAMIINKTMKPSTR